MVSGSGYGAIITEKISLLDNLSQGSNSMVNASNSALRAD